MCSRVSCVTYFLVFPIHRGRATLGTEQLSGVRGQIASFQRRPPPFSFTSRRNASIPLRSCGITVTGSLFHFSREKFTITSGLRHAGKRAILHIRVCIASPLSHTSDLSAGKIQPLIDTQIIDSEEEKKKFSIYINISARRRIFDAR